MNNVWLAFITGLTTGGISCLAVQGGLLASSVAQDEETEVLKTKKWQKVAMFLIAKAVAYTIIGLLLGALGSSLTLTPNFLGYMQITAGIFMILTAARLLNVHPIFRYFVIQPPKWAFRIVKNQSKSKGLFAPALLGALTILVPCGVTQAMFAVAIASGSPLSGALIMLAFTVGTSPVFFAFGVAAIELLKKKIMIYITSGAILILGIISINTGQVLLGSPHTIQNYLSVLGASTTKPNTNSVAEIVDGKQKVTINVKSNGYTTGAKQIKVGVPVKLNLVSKNANGCVRSFVIPSQNISTILPVNGSTELEFTPTKTGLLDFSCGMGMYTGSFTVVN